jgi:hypothetical protein
MNRLVFLIAIAVQAQSVKPDTQALAAKLGSIRVYKALPADEFEELQSQLIAWTDKRVRDGMKAAEINMELRHAAVFKPEQPVRDDDDVMVSFMGFLDPLAMYPISGSKDLMAVKIRIGLMCGFDDTVLVYERAPFRRIGKLDHHDTRFQQGQALSSLVAQGDLMASATHSVWCTSTFIGVGLRIDEIGKSSLKTILSRYAGARFWEAEDKLVRISIENSIVTFKYTASMGDDAFMARSAIARYLVANGTANHLAPIAVSRIGFIDEWLKLKDDEVAKWSTPAAAGLHSLANESFKGTAMHIGSVAKCPGPLRTWQVEISPWSDKAGTTKKWFFLMSEAGASRMRMLKILGEAQPGCAVVNIEPLRILAEDLPQ